LVQWHRQPISEAALREKTVPVPLCPPQIRLRIKPGSPPWHAGY
jgi:hypothetical protein